MHENFPIGRGLMATTNLHPGVGKKVDTGRLKALHVQTFHYDLIFFKSPFVKVLYTVRMEHPVCEICAFRHKKKVL